MDKRAILSIGGCVALLMALSASVQADTPDASRWGFQDASCRAWVASQREPMLRSHYLLWLRGFISGHFAASHRARQGQAVPDAETIVLHVDRYCSDHPDQMFTDEAFSMVKGMHALSSL